MEWHTLSSAAYNPIIPPFMEESIKTTNPGKSRTKILVL